METKRSASLAMVVKALVAVTILACNIVLMKLNAISFFTSLQHLDVFFTTAVMTLEPPLILELPWRSHVLQVLPTLQVLFQHRLPLWLNMDSMLFTIKPRRPAPTEQQRSVSLVMVVKELDAVTTLACNIVLMKPNANSSFTSLQHPVAFFTTTVMRLGPLPILVLPSKSQT
jgi:hypothetical protein